MSDLYEVLLRQAGVGAKKPKRPKRERICGWCGRFCCREHADLDRLLARHREGTL